jgi:hypothetical protein
MDEKEKELLLQVVETSVRTEEAVRNMERELTIVRENLHEYKDHQNTRIDTLEAQVNRNSVILRIGMTVAGTLLSGVYAKLLGIIHF